MQITVFGATGRTGIPLVRQALVAGHEVVAFVRSPTKLTVEHDRLTVVEGDAYTGAGVREAIAGTDAVVSVLGQTDSGPDDLLTVAGDDIIEAMQAEGVSRLVTLVGAGVRTENDSVSLSSRVIGTALKLLAGDVLEDAKMHVDHVRASNLDWTVVRAPRLTKGERTGDYRTGDVEPGFEGVPRADVADFILDCVENEQYVEQLPKIGSG
ncbi:NAD(P)-dependent oxidoreductase [Haladaptatus sp. NG-SE-30]